MKTLTLSLADIEGAPYGSSRTEVEVSVKYTSELRLTDGKIIPAAVLTERSSSPVAEFDVYATDDPAVRSEYHGFAIAVTAKVLDTRGKLVASFATIVKPTQAMSSPINLSTLPPAQPIPPGWVTVGEITGDFDARITAAQNRASSHASRHAAGGADPITPESIGVASKYAIAMNVGDDLNDYETPGTYLSMSSANVNLPISTHGILEVFDRDTGSFLLQRFTSVYESNWGRVFLRTKGASTGNAWTGWKRVDVEAPHAPTHATGGADPITPASIGALSAARWVQGTGSPEGVVAAPPGTEYTDTAGTLGAWKWLKKTGTGTTGWEVTEGDTGWRKIDPYAGWTGYVYLKMTQDTVTLIGKNLNGTDPEAFTNLINVGNAFGPGLNRPIHGVAHTSGAATPSPYDVDYVGALGGSYSNLIRVGERGNWTSGTFSMTWPRNRAFAWPSSLPGTPA